MVGKSPEAALDACVGLLRRTLACVVRGTALASGADLGEDNAVTLFAEGQDGGDPARTRTHDGEGEILFRCAHQYRVVRVPSDPDRTAQGFAGSASSISSPLPTWTSVNDCGGSERTATV